MVMRATGRPQETPENVAGRIMLQTYQAAKSQRLKLGTPEAKLNLARINGIFGNTGSGKSSLIASAGYLNLKYKSYLEKWGCPNTIKVLQKGILPEVEKISIIDTDGGKWFVDMEQGDWLSKYAPLKEAGVFEVTPFQITRTTEVKDPKTGAILLDDPGIEDEKREFESAVINDLRDSSITIVSVDSMSDYIKVLDDKLDITFWDNPKAFNEGDMEGLKTMKQILYGKRAKWFFATLAAARNARRYMFLSFQIKEIPAAYVKKRKPDENFDPTFEDPTYNVMWVPGTGYKLDNVYYVMKDYSGSKFRINWKKGPWPVKKSIVDLPDDPFAYPHVIENHAEALLKETDKDAFAKGDKFW